MQEGSDKIGNGYWVAGVCSLAATIIGTGVIFLHLRHYKRPSLQRYVVRILWMVPIYAISSFVSLSSRRLAEGVELIRDVYEAVVIYTFFHLLLNYLGGQRALLNLLQDRLRIHHLWPLYFCFRPMNMSDPNTFLLVRRGILQFVLMKLVLSLFILILRLLGLYHEGYIALDSSYLWISLIYNVSVSMAMYFLVLFFLQCSKDLEPYRPMPKFLCVKAIIFFSFWQGLIISFLVYLGVIHDKNEYSANNIAAALQNCFICIESVGFAIGHWYAFSWTDYDDGILSSRVSLLHAIRDAFGMKDIVQDTYQTFGSMDSDEEVEDLHFSDPNEEEDDEFAQSRALVYGDYNYPVVRDDPKFLHPPGILDRFRLT